MRLLLLFTSILLSHVTAASSLDGGWYALTEQSDPFDTTKQRIRQISKQDFTIRCGDISFSVPSYGFESLSFGAAIQFKLDDGEPTKRSGKYSTYLGGSDLVTDSRYYSFSLDTKTVEAMKEGSQMKAAGTRDGTGWITKVLDLNGFGPAYDKMCGAGYRLDQISQAAASALSATQSKDDSSLATTDQNSEMNLTSVSSLIANAVSSEMVSATDFAAVYQEGLISIFFQTKDADTPSDVLVFDYSCDKVKNVVGIVRLTLFGNEMSLEGSVVGCEIRFPITNTDKKLLKRIKATRGRPDHDKPNLVQIPTTELSIK